MLKLYFYFLQIVLKFHTFGRSDIGKNVGKKAKPTKESNMFLGILCHCKDFFRKLPKLVNIRNACIVYLLNVGIQFSTFLKYLYCQTN